MSQIGHNLRQPGIKLTSYQEEYLEPKSLDLEWFSKSKMGDIYEIFVRSYVIWKIYSFEK